MAKTKSKTGRKARRLIRVTIDLDAYERHAIEQGRERKRNLGKLKEDDFFTGVMMLHSFLELKLGIKRNRCGIPPAWWVSIIRGESIVKG